MDNDDDTSPNRVRLDKWLWAARFYKTRSLAADEIAKGRVEVNGQSAKASREVHLDDQVKLRQGHIERTVVVLGLSGIRGPAVVAQKLYEETAESVQARERAAALRHQGVEPAATLEQGRPTKRDRRRLADWQRWSVSVDAESSR
ncbi:MAG TPA: RNA-binding S4 domain-containing protein [Burkholderiaceae bacterium]|nr:RNA-binding S4 domain-containing protein [Burkholderiaceae bacterium]